MSNSKTVPLDPLHCCTYSSAALIKHKNHPWISTKRLLFMIARMKKGGIVSYIFDFESSPVTHSDRYCFPCFGLWCEHWTKEKAGKFQLEIHQRGFVTIQFQLDLKRQIFKQSHVTFWGTELYPMFLIFSSSCQMGTLQPATSVFTSSGVVTLHNLWCCF